MTALRAYLQQMADNWAQLGAPALMERFILRNGDEYEGRPLPKGYKLGTPKECYCNAATLVFQRPGLRYVEGYVWREGLPLAIQHAWCIDAKGRVIDNTLQDTERCQYMGIGVIRAELWEELQKTGYYGLLDTGMGLNTNWMFRIDPDLKDIVEGIVRGRAA
jgi:hypothetical protein